MSLQPSNIPQLQNVGLNPAASMLSSGISTLVGAEQAEKDRRNKLLQSLLGGAVNMGEQVLRNRGNLAMTEAQIMSPAQQALALNRLATGAAGLGQAGGISGGVDNVLGQLGIGNQQSPQKELLDGTPSSDQMGLDASGGITGVPQGQEFTKTPQGAFQLGASQQTVLPPTSAGIPADLPLGMSKNLAQIQRAQTSSDLNAARKNKTLIDTDTSIYNRDVARDKRNISRYRQGWFENITNVQAPGEQALSSTGLPMKGLEVTPELAEDQMNIARAYANDPKAYDKRLATLQKDTESITPLLNKVKSLKGLIQPGVNAQIQRNVETGEYMISVTGSKNAAKIKSILNSIVAQVPRIARLYGHTGVLSDPDVEKTLQDIPNALGSKELFDAQYQNFIEALTSGVLYESARLKNKKINDSFQNIYKSATGKDFRYGNYGATQTGSLDEDIDSYINELKQQRQAGF